MLAPKPANLSFGEAAGVPEVWLTAYQSLFFLLISGKVKMF